MLTKDKKTPTRPWFCSICDLIEQCDKKYFENCIEETYQELKDILDKDFIDDLFDEF